VVGTNYGDADLNGVFDSGDLVAVFIEGQYEDSQVRNSSWGSGDWDGDLEFSSADMVRAFQSGTYESQDEVASVPEPALGVWWGVATAAAMVRCVAARSRRTA
jgi:hypothetical protein